MRRRIGSALGLLVGAVLLVSCGEDSRRLTGPSSRPLAPDGRRSDLIAGTCTTLSNLVSLVNAVFGAGSPNANSALGKLSNLDKQLQAGDTAGAQAQAQNIVLFVQTKATQGTLPGTKAQIQALISGVLCYSGLSPDEFLIFPSDDAQVVKSNNGQAGISLQANTVNVPTLITITFLPNDSPPLITKLDQYPGYIALTKSSALTKPAVVGVCPSSTVPADVLGRLRLGHQAATGFEITPPADGSFLNCSQSTAQSWVPNWMQRLASFVLPTPLYAKTLEAAGGVAGSVTEFSPFAPVDDELFLSSGVGGSVTEFQRLPGRDSLSLRMPLPTTPKDVVRAPSRSLTPRDRLNTVVNGVCTQINAVVGTAVETECRPIVTIKTFQGTVLQNVPVGWAIGLGGGVVAPEVTLTHACGVFGSSAATSTDVNGNASVCWTLGTLGTNTVVATPSVGGDAPPGVVFNGAITFTATATQITPTVGATGGTFMYDGLGHPGSGTCSNGLTPVLTYSGDGSVPTNVGNYTLTVTCGAGNPIYVTVALNANIQITGATTTASVSCPASVTYTGTPRTPCTGSVTGPGLSQALTPTYTNNVVGTATATVNYAGGGNYLSSTASAQFKILYVQSGCFASPIYSVMPSTKSFQNKGSNVPVKCTLLNAQGTGVTNATGDLLVQDKGVDGLASPVTVFSLANAFKGTSSGNYSYGLDTSPSGFVSGHYYYVTATWSDGSKTNGWFYIK